MPPPGSGRSVSGDGTHSLGPAAFEPTARVANLSATRAGSVPAGSPILTARSTTGLITATIDAPQRFELHAVIALANGTSSRRIKRST
jgi:hypothetical protein